VSFKRIKETISFDYLHSLSEPRISPDIRSISKQQPLTLEGEAVLRFGLIEGDAIVKGQRVVYDPQSPSNPRGFSDNGSAAERLAIVSNLPETSILAGGRITDDHEELGHSIIAKHNAEVVVIKNGTLGCSVITRSGFGRIPAFKTDFIWKIGSGDVFAALFAHFWAEKKGAPLDAARFASIGTAQYCSSMTLPLRSSSFSETRMEPARPMGRLPKRTVYLAGPFFNLPQRWLIDEARSALLNQGVLVFSPVHDVGRGPAHDVYEPDIDGIKKCDVMFACLDGLDPGTLFEIGFARAIQKPVVVYTTSVRDEDLKMPEGSGCAIVKDFATAIYKTVWAALSL
jgi:nucleoside 2-deoxyribosyltransferase